MTSHARIQQNQVGGEGPDVLDDNVFHRGPYGPPRGQYQYIIRKNITICGFPGGGDRNPCPPRPSGFVHDGRVEIIILKKVIQRIYKRIFMFI